MEYQISIKSLPQTSKIQLNFGQDCLGVYDTKKQAAKDAADYIKIIAAENDRFVIPDKCFERFLHYFLNDHQNTRKRAEKDK
jgi:hypothetical protein